MPYLLDFHAFIRFRPRHRSGTGQQVRSYRIEFRRTNSSYVGARSAISNQFSAGRQNALERPRLVLWFRLDARRLWGNNAPAARTAPTSVTAATSAGRPVFALAAEALP